jgi:hypothetical protein
MGTLHYASLQFFVPATKGEWPSRAYWQHVALFELQKDYVLSAKLHDLAPSTGVADEHTRAEIREEVEFGCHFQVFKRAELPSIEDVYFDDADEKHAASPLYCALLAAAAALAAGGIDVRVVFWRDQ